MSFFQRVGNAMARFMYGRNGGDRLGLVTIWTAVVIDVVCLFIKGYQVPYLILSTLSTAMVCRVPRGKGRIVITCPKCREEIHTKS